jgi:hypothetical protein
LLLFKKWKAAAAAATMKNPSLPPPSLPEDFLTATNLDLSFTLPDKILLYLLSNLSIPSLNLMDFGFLFFGLLSGLVMVLNSKF